MCGTVLHCLPPMGFSVMDPRVQQQTEICVQRVSITSNLVKGRLLLDCLLPSWLYTPAALPANMI